MNGRADLGFGGALLTSVCLHGALLLWLALIEPPRPMRPTPAPPLQLYVLPPKAATPPPAAAVLTNPATPEGVPATMALARRDPAPLEEAPRDRPDTPPPATDAAASPVSTDPTAIPAAEATPSADRFAFDHPGSASTTRPPAAGSPSRPAPVPHDEALPPLGTAPTTPALKTVNEIPPRPAPSPQSSPAPLGKAPPPETVPASSPSPAPAAAGAATKAVPPRPAPQAHNPKPHYPRLARRRGMEGRVLLAVAVDAHGRVTEVTVLESSGYRLLDRAALEAVRRWTFVPARRDGVAVPGRLTLPIRFRLRAG